MDVESLFLRGKEAADGGNYDYAIALFLDIIKEQPEHLKTRRAMRGCEVARFQEKGGSAKISGVFAGLGQLLIAWLPGMKAQKVADACERYLVNDPTSTAVLCRLASAYEKLGFLEAAADTLEFARQRKPDSLSVLRRLGEVCYKMGEYDKAIRSFQDIVRRKPADRNAAQRAKEIAAESHLKRSHMGDAKSYRETLRDESLAESLAQEGRVARTKDEKADRVALCRQAADETPDGFKVWRNLGDALYHAENYAEAENAYKKEFEISKRYEARERVGNARLRRLEQIERAAVAAAKQGGHPLDLVVNVRKAKSQRIDFAIKEFEFRRRQHPTDLQLAWHLGRYYYERGGDEDFQQAIKQFQQAVASTGLRSKAQLMLARCFAKDAKTLDMAKDQLLKALEEVEDQTLEIGKDLMYELAGVEERLGRKDEASKYYKKIYAVDAGYQDVARKVQELG